MTQTVYDQIKIQDLEVFANHGVFPEENTLGQKFLISAVLYTDTRKAGQSDDLKASIHYGEVSAFINRYLKSHTFKLLERAAEALAEELLLHTPGLEKVCLEIKKPWAPIGLPLKTVSVKIQRGWHTAYIALGSNLGDREQYIKDAVKALDTVRGCSVEKVSSLIETPPYGVTDQADFLNYRLFSPPGNCSPNSIGSSRRQAGSGSSAGVPGHWIWTSYFMTILSGKTTTCASPMWKCTKGFSF